MSPLRTVEYIAPILMLLFPAILWGASRTMTVAEIALYKSVDREKILLEGAKNEGQLSIYTSNSVVAGVVAQAFEKKFPFIKVSAWTAKSPMQLKRVLEENRAARYIADVAESSPESMGILRRENLLQEIYSPELAAYGDETKVKGTSGVVYWANREIYFSLGFNTKMIPSNEAPKVLKDLLEPKLKGNIGISGRLIDKHKIKASDVTKIIVRLPERAAQTVNNRHMPDVNVQYILAVTLLDGRLSFEAAHDYERMQNHDVQAIMARVHLEVDLEMDKTGPRYQALVEVTTAGGQLLREHVINVRGRPENPMSAREVEEKARELMAPVLGDGRVDKLFAAIRNLEAVRDISELRPLLIKT